MRVIIQRVLASSVRVNSEIVGEIQKGLLVLVGFEESDNIEDIEWISKKIIQLRIFNDQNNIMNLSLTDILFCAKDTQNQNSLVIMSKIFC